MDIACLGAPNGFRAGQAGLVEKLDPAKVPNLKHVPDFLRQRLFRAAHLQRSGARL